MIFLKPDEVPQYTSSPISDVSLNQANVLVESVIGNIGKQQKVNERVDLLRGTAKLSKIRVLIPLVSIDAVKAYSSSPFGQSATDVDPSKVDVDEFGYIRFQNECHFIWGTRAAALSVTYTWGYDTDSIPADLKLATAQIATNMGKRGVTGIKSLADPDSTVVFMSDSIITPDLLNILNKYKGV